MALFFTSIAELKNFSPGLVCALVCYKIIRLLSMLLPDRPISKSSSDSDYRRLNSCDKIYARYPRLEKLLIEPVEQLYAHQNQTHSAAVQRAHPVQPLFLSKFEFVAIFCAGTQANRFPT